MKQQPAIHRKKITIAGAGHVGSTVAQLCAYKQLGDIVLLDIVEGMPQAKALDIAESGPLELFDANITGTNDYENSKDSDVIVICSGLPRKSGMTREDLRDTNAEIVKNVTTLLAEHSPGAFLIVVTNPLDTMTWVAKKYSNFPKERVTGMAGVLDSTRFRTFVAMELGVSNEDVSAMVLGLHGPLMVPLPRYTTVSGVPITELMTTDQIERLVLRTREGGTEIVKLMKSGSAYYAAGSSIVQMIEAYLLDRNRILPCAAWLEGEYGLSDIFMGVPVMLGSDGIEKVLELELTNKEMKFMQQSAEHIRESISNLKV